MTKVRRCTVALAANRVSIAGRVRLADSSPRAAHLLQSRTADAIAWLEKARSAVPDHPHPHGLLAAVYALEGQTERARVELAEARKLFPDDRLATIARGGGLAVSGYWSGAAKSPEAPFEATYFAGLRKLGVPEE